MRFCCGNDRPAECGELLLRRLESRDGFAVGRRSAGERLLDAELRGEAAIRELDLHERDRDEPRREAVEHREIEAGRARPLGDAGVVLAEHVPQAVTLGQHCRDLHRLDQRHRIGERVVHVDLHDELLGIGVGRVCNGRQGAVLRPQNVQGAEEIDGVAGAIDRPEHVTPVGCARGGNEQRGHEQPRGQRSMNHPL